MKYYTRILFSGLLLFSIGCSGGGAVTMPEKGLDESNFKPSQPEDIVAGQGGSKDPGMKKK